MTLTEARPELDVADGDYAGTDTPLFGMIREDVKALVAATFPAKPPSQWFDDPRLKGPTPLTVTNDGRVYGHIATWRQSHIGMAGGIRPPRSRSKYAFFATGALETAEGKMVNVGQVTLTGGHAPLEASVPEAVAHYDNTDSAVMDVAIGEDRTGVWVAGALRPDVDEHRIRATRASSVSGDWRPINGSLELVAVCAVNVPGFPIPRARVAGGQPVALVAAGTEDLAYVSILDRAGIDIKRGISLGMRRVDERVKRVEQALLASSQTQTRQVDTAIKRARKITAAGRTTTKTPRRARTRPVVEADQGASSLEVRRADLRTRVRPSDTSAPSVATPTKLRSRVHADVEWGGDMMPIEASVVDCRSIALRNRIRGGVQATATKAWNAKTREGAAKKGQALPEGGFPIRDKTDLAKAIKAYGRAKNKPAAKRHIKKRARALGATKALPEDWKK
jgi:hypothetical protein